MAGCEIVMGYRFNPPPNWPAPPPGWVPLPGWLPAADWPAPPPGWQLWVDDEAGVGLTGHLSPGLLAAPGPAEAQAAPASPAAVRPVLQVLDTGAASAVPGPRREAGNWSLGGGRHAGSVLAENAGPAANVDGEQAFDLNIEKVLEHWTVPFAIRELIANALDEQALTGTAEPAIYKDSAGDWHVADGGRGLRYDHLTQNESAEKRASPQVIGQFGMGLKDALAVFDRRGIGVEIRSGHGDITTGRRPKEGFPDVITLHALVSPPSDPSRAGTDITLKGVSDEDVAAARQFFLRYSGEQLLESTEHGDVLARRGRRSPARVYVKGLLVAEEPNFLFSYNVTRLSAALRRALNRERSNVGRSAYTDRVKAILIACRSTSVAAPLADDLNGYSAGQLHDELAWRDVALHACRVLQTHEKVVFATAWQLADDTAQLEYARGDGYRIVVVPDDIARSLGDLTDLDGRPLVDLSKYRDEWNESFTFDFVGPDTMTPGEREVYDRIPELCALAGVSLAQRRVSVEVSKTMRLSVTGDPVLGLWEEAEHRIVVRRDQLSSLATFAATFLHEIGHMASGTSDGTIAFEIELSRLLGLAAAAALGRA